MNPTGELWPWILVSLLLGIILGRLSKFTRRPRGIGIDRSAEIATLSSDLDAARRDRSAAERELERARGDVARLTAEVAAVRTDAATAAAGAVAGGRPRSVTVTEIDGDSRATVTTGDPTDLTRLKGVGPKLAALLRAEGVATLADMAALDGDRAAALDARLGDFAGRVASDRLPEQARLLVEGRDAEYAARFGAP